MAWTFQQHHRLDPRVSGLPVGQDPSPHTPGPPTHPHPSTAFISPSWIWWAYYSTVNSFNYIFTIIDHTTKWMEAIPLSETSAAACAKASTFIWISRFGIPKTITSDHGPQFTPNFLLQLCEMLNILHRQTTAIIVSPTGQSKECASASAAAVTWSEELPFLLLGLRAQPREDTGLSPAEAVFGAPIVLPNEFLKNEEI